MLKPEYTNLSIDSLELDVENPRISNVIAQYKEVGLNEISLALHSSGDESSSTSFDSLKDSIKVYGGLISPIIVNRDSNGKLTVIEGNTRLSIYKEFNKTMPGKWDEIPTMLYENMPQQQIDSIRLQAHLVGPRSWDPYSKARYLNHLSNSEHLTTTQIIDYCGGKKREVNEYIAAYIDMEQYYRPIEENFDTRKFSAFVELQKKSIENTLRKHNVDKQAFAEWVRDGKFGTQLTNIRKLPRVMNDPHAKEVFLAGDIEDAWRELDTNAGGQVLDKATLEQLASEISKRIAGLTYQHIIKLREDLDSDERVSIQDARDSLISLWNDMEVRE